MWSLKPDGLLYAVIAFLSVLALAGLLCGCTYASVRVDYPDGTTLKGKYIVVAQNRTLKGKTERAKFSSTVSNEPAQYLVTEAVPLAGAAALKGL